ncbi:YbfB/YjiJ family MFS transporter [Roseococcus sp. SYP-B2431]|uniref:YbfB/YjiJ family MFS transporter n=1 Tax=Roseococcus sp. SYP-B2431 TaxID=2496640 RepID=UPI00103AE93D|nr:YbfB/YjiJ family MFS transporter [Roseococcus sp. SYP-B2431]TCH98895.1 YbfB/YjiJ family MFS transporter [Roseococcus sp. SYP-B2431]
MSARNSLTAAFAGAAATCAGNGLARFAFVPLFPALVTAGWVTGAEAGALGAANLAGYLLGALGAQAAGRRLGTRPALGAGMAGLVASLLLCAIPGGVAWLLPWRFLAGVGAGVLMSLAGPAAQRAAPPSLRGTASGIVIGGVGLGIAAGALAVPALLLVGPSTAWLGLAALVAGLWIFAQPRFPADPGGRTEGGRPPLMPFLLLAYALSGAGLVPHMIYLADFAARGFGLGVTAGSGIWLIFGLGGLAGTMLGGRAADRIGGPVAARIWLGVQVAALALALAPWWPALLLSALAGGFAAVGISAVTLAWAREVAGPAAGALWVRATVGFAVTQAAMGFGFAALFGATGESHHAVFLGGLLFSAMGFAATLAPHRA